jgi:hypothetical protein
MLPKLRGLDTPLIDLAIGMPAMDEPSGAVLAVANNENRPYVDAGRSVTVA